MRALRGGEKRGKGGFKEGRGKVHLNTLIGETNDGGLLCPLEPTTPRKPRKKTCDGGQGAKETFRLWRRIGGYFIATSFWD